MANKPVILAVDDDPEVSRAVERDLRHQYGDQYRIIRVESSLQALDIVKALKLRNDVIALFVCDYRMPELNGIEFLTQARPIFPEAKRVLLTAYADTDAAIQAINLVKIDFYLMKPWNPPEEQLYPVLDDLLADWQSSYHPTFDGIRVIGHQWSSKSHAVKDFLARNQIPYQWLDVEQNPDAENLLAYAQLDRATLPAVLFPDGGHLVEPTTQQLAEKAGLKTRAEKPFYDLAIVGGGPAGLAAAVYGASEGLRTVMVEREAPGGQAGTSSRIENYLGFPVGLSGADLARRAVIQAKRFGVEILTPAEVTQLRVQDVYRVLTLSNDCEISCHALLIATGVSYRKLDVPGLDRLTGAGVYYGAAMTEALSCKDDVVYIVGGANSAGQSAMYFARYARQVIMLVRGPSLSQSMSQYLIDQIGETPNIVVRPCTEVVEAHGEGRLESLTIVDNNTQLTETVPAVALFIFIGAQPRTDWLGNLVVRDKNGFILTGAQTVSICRKSSAQMRSSRVGITALPLAI
ncbi:MAG TPA: FAD-dependent oxidoreductase [Phototrophicaceae bacterium]|nr:FAD-dependent oxidoreductase [Phototrophicaceae bacterium]